MPIEYAMLSTLTAAALAVGVYALYLRHKHKQPNSKQPQMEAGHRFEREVIAQLRHAKETGESVTLTEKGWPTVEIHPKVQTSREALGKLKGSVMRYDRPTDSVGD